MAEYPQVYGEFDENGAGMWAEANRWHPATHKVVPLSALVIESTPDLVAAIDDLRGLEPRHLLGTLTKQLWDNIALVRDALLDALERERG